MNQRIDDLMYQAGLTAQGCLDKMDDYDRKAILKFAELIVRECAGVCDDERDSTDSEFGKLVAECCALTIMERFGVE